MRKRNLSQPLLVWAVTILLMTASAGIFFADRDASDNFSITEEIWDDYVNRAGAKARLLRDIRASLGYGGFIHNFKNYVLRRDAGRGDLTRANAVRVRTAIDAYEDLGTTSEEQQALDVVRATLEEYIAKLPVAADAVQKGASPAEIDRLVKVEDAPALKAMAYLESLWFTARGNASQHLTESVASGRQAMKRSALIVLLLLPAVLLAVIMLRRLLGQATRRAEALENEINVRAEVEKNLRESEEQLRLVMDNVAEGVITIDLEGTILSFNRSAQRIFGYQADEAIGKPITFLMSGHHKEHHKSYIARYLATGETTVMGAGREVVGCRKNGEDFPVNIAISELKVNDKHIFIGSLSDLTERKALEQQLLRSQRMQAVGQLTGGIAHDFNNLMGIIIGNAEMLEDSVANNSFAIERLESIKSAVDRGARLTDRLLVFSRKQTLIAQTTDIASLVRELDDMLRRTLGATISLKTELPSALWPVTIDPNQFENAIINIAVNARDAMPLGGWLTITADQLSLSDADAARIQGDDELTPGEYVRISVRDTGHGMTKEVLARVFEPFFTTKDVGKGSGLGLSMVYGFAQQSKGHVAVSSTPDVGSTIDLYLPRSLDVVKTSTQVTEPVDLAQGSERILVVEDDPEIREISAAILRGYGYIVTESIDGKSAFECLEKASFDLLFTDIVLPHSISGFEIAKEAVAKQPNIKVLFATGYAEHSVLQSDEAASLDHALINKPFQRKELLAKVRSVLDAS